MKLLLTSEEYATFRTFMQDVFPKMWDRLPNKKAASATAQGLYLTAGAQLTSGGWKVPGTNPEPVKAHLGRDPVIPPGVYLDPIEVLDVIYEENDENV